MTHSESTDYKSDSEIVEDFLNTFQLLSTKQKKIWELLRWYSINHHAVFPSHSTIAKKIGCCRDTVIQAIKKFSELGWIVSIRRCYRSCLYFMNGILKKFDTKRNDTFYRNPTENPTENPTLYIPYSSLCNERYANPPEKVTETVQSIKDQKQTNLHKKHLISQMGIFDPKDVWCLLRYPELALIRASEDLKTRWGKDAVRNVAAWITTQCKKHMSKLG